MCVQVNSRIDLAGGFWPLKGPLVFDEGSKKTGVCCLTSESVQGATLAFQSIDDVHGGDGLPLGVLGVGDGVTDDVL